MGDGAVGECAMADYGSAGAALNSRHLESEAGGISQEIPRAEGEIVCGASLRVEWIAAEQCRFTQVLGYCEGFEGPKG